MKKLFLSFLFTFLFISCRDTNVDCPVENDFKIVQNNFNPNILDMNDANLYAYYQTPFRDKAKYEIKISPDNGYSWATKCLIEPDSSQNLLWKDMGIRDFIESEDGAFWIADSSGRLFKSTNQGLNWIRMNDPLGNYNGEDDYTKFPVSDIIKVKNGVIFLYNSYDGIFRSKNNGSSWDCIVKKYDAEDDFIKIIDDKIFILKKSGVLNVSNDYGNTWIESEGINANEIQNFISGRFPKNTSIIQGDNSKFYLSIGGNFEYLLYSSSDNGLTWGGGILKIHDKSFYLNKLINANIKGEIFAYGNYEGACCDCYFNEGIYKSSDDGVSWAPVLHMYSLSSSYIPPNNFITNENYAIFLDSYDRNLKISKWPIY